MLTAFQISASVPGAEQAAIREALERDFPGLAVEPGAPTATDRTALERAGGTVTLAVSAWNALRFDPTTLDDVVATALTETGSVTLCLAAGRAGRGTVVPAATQIVTRCQRLLRTRNRPACTPFFDEVLAMHRSLHDLSKPLVAADFDHTLDTWRWTLRLDPDASLEVQIAALLHDVERLVSESEVRIEQHAPNYVDFKQAHARAGASMARDALDRLGADAGLAGRVADLVATHETPGTDPEKLLLNEADALSFFSLNACGFLKHYGRAHTVKKVAYSLGRLRARGRTALLGIRHRADIAGMLMEAAAVRATSPEGGSA